MIEQHREMWAAYKKLNEKIEEKTYEPKEGEYYVVIGDTSKWICIAKEIKEKIILEFANLNCRNKVVAFDELTSKAYPLRPVTPEEIALLDSKLAEQGKFFNKETMRIEEIKKEPIIGEMVIGWELNKKEAIVGVLNDVYEYCKDMLAYKISGRWLRNAIPFESTEQYKNLIKNA